MQLQIDTLLHQGEYRILSVLGQGGFGVTYLAYQVSLERRVAIKEFFMKEYCVRDKSSSYVNVTTEHNRELVARFRDKFVKEARCIANLSYPHIVRVIDVFEENGTSYYVMDYLGGGTLQDYVRMHGALSLTNALVYIRQVASALDYIHGRNLLHLDVTPSNIMLNDSGEAVLVGFGVSKRYDELGQTSNTPLGISEGYAPLELYESGGIDQFSPSTDIYSLGATFYYLLTGSRPPKASTLLNGSLSFPSSIPEGIQACIVRAMAPSRRDRPQNVGEFLRLLEIAVGGGIPKTAKDQDAVSKTIVATPEEIKREEVDSSEDSSIFESLFSKRWIVPVVVCLLVCLFIYLFWGRGSGTSDDLPTVLSDTLSVGSEGDAIAGGEELSSSVSSESSQCLFYVTTSPSGAQVVIDGKSYGKSPLSDVKVPVGDHEVRLTLSGYEPFSRKISFSNRPVILNEILRAERSETSSSSSSSSNKAQTSSITVSEHSVNGHDYVDLGLSVKWAACNIGASRPEAYGSYYAWGETRTKSEYKKENSLTYEKDMVSISGDSRYDVASAQWGGSWRLPTKAEFQELRNKCKWEWITVGGHRGYRITGPNGNSIFLPAAGSRDGKKTYNQGLGGNYWTGTISEDYYHSYYFYFNAGTTYCVGTDRCGGCTVRPVLK